MERNVEKFCGMELFEWEEWDIMDTGDLYFYKAKWLLESMQKYNGLGVELMIDGTVRIDNEDATECIFEGCLLDIKEVVEYACDRKSTLK